MKREEIYNACLQAMTKSNCLLLEAATGTGKSKQSIDLVNHLCETKLKGRHVKMLLLVAKRVHKVTWKEEFEKWGGIKADEVVMECYESLRKHQDEHFDVIVADECHHLGSETRMSLLKSLKFQYMIGLSATIPRSVKSFFKFNYHSQIVSCDIIEAIEDDVLPEPEILLYPLKLDNTINSEVWEINPKAKGPVVHGEYKDLWKFKKTRQHALLSCTQRQKSNELNSLALFWKNRFNQTHNEAVKQLWLRTCGDRLEFYADIKIPIIKKILKKLQRYRTITFCKTIEQCEDVSKYCIHSKNQESDEIYDRFNQKKINHIAAVNILNENANLVDCKYAIFGNLSSSEVVVPQRLGRAMRHKKPVIIIPYWEGTREQELVEKQLEDFDKDFIRVIHSIDEI